MVDCAALVLAVFLLASFEGTGGGGSLYTNVFNGLEER